MKVLYVRSLSRKQKNILLNRKNVILLREKCKNLPSLSEINSLDFTDRVHLILQAHRYYKYVQLDEMLFEEENIVIYLDTWIEQFWNGTVNLRKIKSNLRPVFIECSDRKESIFMVYISKGINR